MTNESRRSYDAVKVYKALGEPTRLQIVQLLCKHQELSCSEIGDKLNLTAGSTLSHHLKQLTDSGVVELTRIKTYHYHRVREDVLQQYAPILLEKE
jgi:DNA-binding transcriptional ArsR family regulator